MNKYENAIAWKETLPGAQGCPGEIKIYRIENNALTIDREYMQEGFEIPKNIKDSENWKWIGLCSRHYLYIPCSVYEEFIELGPTTLKSYEEKLKRIFVK